MISTSDWLINFCLLFSRKPVAFWRNLKTAGWDSPMKNWCLGVQNLIFHVDCSYLRKMYSSSLFLIYSAIAQQINSHHFRISTLGTSSIRFELEFPRRLHSTERVAAFKELESRGQFLKISKPSRQISLSMRHVYFGGVFGFRRWCHGCVLMTISKSPCIVKVRSNGCWKNIFACVSRSVVVDYDEFG